MSTFQVKPKIQELSSMAEVIAINDININTLIFTEKLFYQSFLADKALDCQFIFLDDFGLGEPIDSVIDDLLEPMQALQFDQLIAIGGGTILDIAKIISLSNIRNMDEVFDKQDTLKRDVKLMMIPTTCGTGAEVTAVSVVYNSKLKTKVGIRIEASFADKVYLVEELLKNIPQKIFIDSSMDALIHAMEIFVAPTSNPYNELFCREAITLILNNYQKLQEEGVSYFHKYLKEFVRASNFAGIALSNTVCGAVHALAMHFGGNHSITHGEATTRFLMPVFNKYVALSPTGKLLELGEIIKESLRIEGTLPEVFSQMGSLLNEISQPKSLEEYGMKIENIPVYASAVLNTQQRLLINNFIPLSKNDLITIYQDSYSQ